MHTSGGSRSERIDIRTTPAVKQLLKEAAEASHKHVSEFLLEQGIAAAEQLLLNRQIFRLDEASWKAFARALEAPPKPRPNLEKLFRESGELD